MLSLSLLGLTCDTALHPEQHNDEANQDCKEEHYDNSHHHTNDESSVVSVNKWSWRKRHNLMSVNLDHYTYSSSKLTQSYTYTIHTYM